MHIVLGIWQITTGKGGAERMGVLTAGAMRARGHKVTILHRKMTDSVPFFPVPEGVALVPVQHTRRHWKESRRIVRELGADVCLSCAGGGDLLMMPPLLKGLDIPSVCGLHHNPISIMNYAVPPYEYYGALATCDHIQVLCPSYLQHLPEFLRERTVVIPNCCPLPPVIPKEPTKPSSLLGASRNSASSFRCCSGLSRSFAPVFPTGSWCWPGMGRTRRPIWRSSKSWA